MSINSMQTYEAKFKGPSIVVADTNNHHGDVRIYKPNKQQDLVLKKTVTRKKWSKERKIIELSVMEIRTPDAYTCADCGLDGLMRTNARQVRCAPCQQKRILARARENSKKYQAVERERLKKQRAQE